MGLSTEEKKCQDVIFNNFISGVTQKVWIYIMHLKLWKSLFVCQMWNIKKNMIFINK